MPRNEILNLPSVPVDHVTKLDEAYLEAVRKLPLVYRRLRKLATGRATPPGGDKAYCKASDEIAACKLYLELFDPRLVRQRADAQKVPGSEEKEEAEGKRRMSTAEARNVFALLEAAGVDVRTMIDKAQEPTRIQLDPSRVSQPIPAMKPAPRSTEDHSAGP